MSKIETIKLRCLHPEAQKQFYITRLGMGLREDGAVSYSDAEAGIEDVFADIVALANDCRFNDCSHEAEPGCAIVAAINAGTLDAKRYRRWQKLTAEETRNSESLAQRRSRDRAFGKMVKGVMRAKQQRTKE